ncbi:hypothetical protein [Listeria booriae]|uniref:hypothetical protein n=1 Tax=Listeria booriae TaxID=1552123 RepID=UPI001624256C|nr:hypothetical protein [Listeria booriae]
MIELWPFVQATEAEEKRDKYQSLYNKLDHYYNEYKNKESELLTHQKNYVDAMSTSNKECVTAAIYDTKEADCLVELNKLIAALTDKASIIEGLKTTAKTKYDYYKHKAVQEAAGS